MQGLGLARLSKQRVVPPFQAALPQLDAPLFSLWLNPDTAPSAPAGALVLGGLQPARCAGPLAWHPVVSDRRASPPAAQSEYTYCCMCSSSFHVLTALHGIGTRALPPKNEEVAGTLHRYWAVSLGGVSTHGAGSPAALEAHAALLDSGTSLLLASDADAAAINGVRIPRPSLAMVPCLLLTRISRCCL